MLVRSRLVRRRGKEHAPRWPTTQPRQIRTARRVLRRRSADAPRHERRVGRIRTRQSRTFEGRAADLSRYWCGRAPADCVRRRAPHVGPQYNHAKCALRSACSVGGRPILHGAIYARATRYEIRTRWLRSFGTRAVDLSRCWCGRSLADGAGRSAPRVGPQHNNAMSALRGVCSLGGRPLLHGTICARAARHEIQIQWYQLVKARAVNLSRCWCGRALADGVGRSAPRFGPQYNRAKSALFGACSVGGRPILHYSICPGAVRHEYQAQWPRRFKPVQLTCRGVGAIAPRPTAWGGARRALAHNTTTPSPHCTA